MPAFSNEFLMASQASSKSGKRAVVCRGASKPLSHIVAQANE